MRRRKFEKIFFGRLTNLLLAIDLNEMLPNKYKKVNSCLIVYKKTLIFSGCTVLSNFNKEYP